MSTARSFALAASIACTAITLVSDARADTMSAVGPFQSLTLTTSSSDANALHIGMLLHNNYYYRWGGTSCSNYANLSTYQIELLGKAVAAGTSGSVGYKVQGNYRCIVQFTI